MIKLDDETKQKYANQIVSEIEQVIPRAIDYLSESHSPYKYLIEYIPTITGSDIPKATKRQLDSMNHSPACYTTAGYVAIDAENSAISLVEAVASKVDNESDLELKLRYTDFIRELRTILAHEYTHIVCEHIERAQRHRCSNPADVKTYMAAEEIEANRGWGVDVSTNIYSIGVTEAKFPETKNCYTLETIYKALKQAHNKDIDNALNKKQNAQQSAGIATAGGSGSVVASKAGNHSSGDDGGGSNGSANGSLNAEQQQALENFANEDLDKQLDNATQQTTQQPANANNQQSKNGAGTGTAETQDTATGGSMSAMLNAVPEGVYQELDGLTPMEKLEKINSCIEQKRIAKSLAKLKATIKGNASKTKTKTYARPARRANTSGLMLKGKKRDKRSVPKVLVALDCSGSMDNAKITSVAAAIDGIVKQLGRTTKGCYICLHNGTVTNVRPLSQAKAVADKFYAHGGNDFSKVYKKALELNVDVVLNVGDGLDRISRNAFLDYLQNNNTKPLEWYDVLVTKLGSYMQDYESECTSDSCKGIERKCISLVGETK